MSKHTQQASGKHGNNGAPDSAAAHIGNASAHVVEAADKLVEGVQVANVAARKAIRDGISESGPALRAAGAEARAAGSSAMGEVEQRMSELGDKSRQLASRSGQFVRDRPLAALGIAVASGFLLSRLLRR